VCSAPEDRQDDNLPLEKVGGRLHQLGSQLGVRCSYTGKTWLLVLELVKEGMEHAGVALPGRHWLTRRHLEVDTTESGFRES